MCLFFREDGVAVITPSGEDVALEIIVSNSDGEDAHQSHVVVNLPDLLRYSSVVYASTSVSEPQVISQFYLYSVVLLYSVEKPVLILALWL